MAWGEKGMCTERSSRPVRAGIVRPSSHIYFHSGNVASVRRVGSDDAFRTEITRDNMKIVDTKGGRRGRAEWL